MAKRSAEGDVLTDIVLGVFRLNGRLLSAADGISRPAGLTAARWQVLGAILEEPQTVPWIAARMGLSRQAVQQLADILVRDGLVAFEPNPLHKRSKLLRVTADGHAAIARLRPRQHRWANDISEGLDAAELKRLLDLIDDLCSRVEARSDEPS